MTQGKLAESVAESIPGYDPEKHGIAAAVVTKTSDTTIARMIAEMDAAIGGHDNCFGEPHLHFGRNTLWAARDALALLGELAESDPEAEPLACHHCGEELPRHLDTCLWLRARKMAGVG